MIPQNIIDEVRNRSEVFDVVSEAGFSLKRQGNSYVCCCPFHSERTPSFHVNKAKNLWYCFGCHEGGDAIDFIMKYHNVDFFGAIELQARALGMQYEEREATPEEIEKAQRRECAVMAMKVAQQYFLESLGLEDPKAKAAKAYLLSRWSKETIESEGLGYALDNYHGLIDFAKKRGVSEEALLDAGLIRRNDKGKTYDFFRDRVTFPEYSRSSMLIGYTARTMSDNKDVGKYINLTDTLLYAKSRSIYGLNTAARAAATSQRLYMVEGAPDVVGLHQLGVMNVVAPLGTAWTEDQFAILKPIAPNLCFLPDSDKPKDGEQFGAGVRGVIRNGAAAFKQGFKVTVKEIPLGEGEEKADPDSYFESAEQLQQLEEKPFILWYADKLFANAHDLDAKSKAINQISELLAYVDDDIMRNMLVTKLCEYGGSKALWNNAIRAGIANRKEAEKPTKQREIDSDTRKYGFEIIDNCYCSRGKDGDLIFWSNFIMIPHYHIRDEDNDRSFRSYTLINRNGEIREVEFEQEDLINLARFKKKVESLGNFIWSAKEDKLTLVKQYLYGKTRTATLISRLGWSPNEFYAYGNGIYNGQWHPVNNEGIVDLNGDSYYLPANAKVNRNMNGYQFERAFIYGGDPAITLPSFTRDMVAVFGDNAKIGLCFLVAALHRDIIFAITDCFPIMNVFGQKGSGKSAFCDTFMGFFVTKNEPPTLDNCTVAALNDILSQSVNALTHLEEYKNCIMPEKIDVVKASWGGLGRKRMNMNGDRKAQSTQVSSGIILSGQEMATLDTALFERVIFLSYSRDVFSPEEDKRFNDFAELRKRGYTHLVPQILDHRKLFVKNFSRCYKEVADDINAGVGKVQVVTRLKKNWTIILASFKALESVLGFPFTYEEILPICIEKLLNQNSMVRKTDEVGDYWSFISNLFQSHQIIEKVDFFIANREKIKTESMSESQRFNEPRKLLFLKIDKTAELFRRANQFGTTAANSKSSMLFLLRHSEGCYGATSQKFALPNNYGEADLVVQSVGMSVSRQVKTHIARCLVFDYAIIRELYGIDLEIELVQSDENLSNVNGE